MIKQNDPDLIFLDVQLTDGTGFEVLESLSPLRGVVIFTTAYDHYAIKAFKFSAIDYLLKPIDIDELKTAVTKVPQANSTVDGYKLQNLLSNLKRVPEEDPVLLVPSMESIDFVRIEDIIRCEANGAYSMLHLREGRPLMVSKVIKEFEFLLKDYGFYRVHQSHLINLKEIRKYVRTHNSILMRDGTELQLARSRKEGFFERMSKLKI